MNDEMQCENTVILWVILGQETSKINVIFYIFQPPPVFVYIKQPINKTIRNKFRISLGMQYFVRVINLVNLIFFP